MGLRCDRRPNASKTVEKKHPLSAPRAEFEGGAKRLGAGVTADESRRHVAKRPSEGLVFAGLWAPFTVPLDFWNSFRQHMTV